MNAYREVMVQVHLFLILVLDGGEWSTLCPGHINPRKEPQYPMNRRLGGPQSECFGEEKNFLPLL